MIQDIKEAVEQLVIDEYHLSEVLKENETILELVKDDEFAQELYAAMCNMQWVKNGIHWGCTWRSSGGIVAELRNQGENYMDFYCSGNEGFVSERVRNVLGELGWEPKEYEDE